jgi:tRNA dimethylallyltransferase
VARPTEEELATVPHHFIASHSIHEEVTAVVFEEFAVNKCQELFISHDFVIMPGGTGLYIKAFCEGLDEIPAIDPAIRRSILENYEREGLSWLQQQVQVKDPGFYQTGEIQNPQRMMRALEVIEGTQKSILQYRKGKKVKRNFNIVKLGLELSKDELHRNITSRVAQMMNNGLLDEVRSLLPYKDLNALQTVGYRELFEHLEGRVSLDEAIQQIISSTKQYAKRQLTWFRKDKEISWFHPSDLEKIKEHLVMLFSGS